MPAGVVEAIFVVDVVVVGIVIVADDVAVVSGHLSRHCPFRLSQ